VTPDGLVEAIASALTDLHVSPPAEITLERPRQADHGDWSSNVAMATAKAAGRNPREIATALAEALNKNPPPFITAVEVAGPGFLNFRVSPDWRGELVRRVVAQGSENFARPTFGVGHSINLEYVSGNPTGPLHAGHGRWAAYGDSLGRVMQRCGYEVHREFYVNDRGVQVQTFGQSLLARKKGTEIPEGGYHGEYVKLWAAEMPDDADPVEWGLVRAHQDQRDTLAAMGVEFDTWASEKALVSAGAIEAVLQELRQRGYVFEEDGAVWLRTTDFGDDKDRVLIKADGEPTYFLPDIAYHRDKFTRGAHLVDILGADHHGYIGRMAAAVQALGHDAADYEAIIGQNVVLIRGGAEVRLSRRAGDIISLAEVIDEVGADATRFTYLLNSIDTKLTFDLDLVVQRTMDNPVFYVQMAHARLWGITRNAAEKGVVRNAIDSVDLTLLQHPREIALVDALVSLPDAMRDSAERRSPNRISTWARELAAAVHGFHHDCWVVSDDVSPELSQARLWLCEAARVGLLVGLGVLGVSAPESM
jgi:arginyl-tRNA synthetase